MLIIYPVVTDDIYDELVMNTDTAVPTAAVPGEDNSSVAGVNLQRYEISAISKILYDLADILDLMATRPRQTKGGLIQFHCLYH